jgi:hypothetical protein
LAEWVAPTLAGERPAKLRQNNLTRVSKQKEKHMPLTKTGRKVKRAMTRTYGKKKGAQVFYASINKGKKGSKRWHKARRR